MTLTSLYHTLAAQARRRGTDQATELRGGARIAVRITPDGQYRVTFSRINRRLSDTEVVTFHRHCQIPGEATKKVGETQLTPKEKRYWVAYAWREVVDEAAPSE